MRQGIRLVLNRSRDKHMTALVDQVLLKGVVHFRPPTTVVHPIIWVALHGTHHGHVAYLRHICFGMQPVVPMGAHHTMGASLHNAHMTGISWGVLLQSAIFMHTQTILHPHPVHVLFVITLRCRGIGAYGMLVTVSMECYIAM